MQRDGVRRPVPAAGPSIRTSEGRRSGGGPRSIKGINDGEGQACYRGDDMDIDSAKLSLQLLSSSYLQLLIN